MPEPQTMIEAIDTAEAAKSNGGGREAELKLWRWLTNVADESERVRREEARTDEWGGWLDLYYGKHWPKTLPTFRPPVVANELRTLILSEAAELTDSQLRIYVIKDPSHGGRDEEVERALRAIWVREQIDLKIVEACIWARVIGTSFLGVQWDPEAYNGMGDVTVDVRDPRTVLPDPDAIDDRKWMYRIIDIVLDISEIRRMFPISGVRVKPEVKWSVKDTRSVRDSSPQSSSYTGPLYGGSSLVHGSLYGYKKARARVLDCIVKDDAVEETIEEMKGPDGKPLLDESGEPRLRHTVGPKYPNGRRIVGANEVILYDGDSPDPGNDFGLVRVVLDPCLSRFWGTGFVQQTAELQLAADKLLSATVENAIRLNNGVVVSTTNTGLDWESFAGIPAQIVQINPGSEFKIQYPPAMPSDMIQAPHRMLELQRQVLGFPSSRVGISGRGNVSPELTETEISQSQSVTRLSARYLYYVVSRLAQMIFSRMAFGYRTERVIPAVEGETFKPVRWKPLENPKQYSLYIDPASFSVMSRTMLRRLGVALYRLRAIDRQALLETIGWPEWEKTSKRLDQMDVMMAVAKIKQKTGGKR